MGSPDWADRLYPQDTRKHGLLRTIARYGWANQHVGPGATQYDVIFSYTVGLTGLGHPELMLQGMPHKSAQVYLNLAGEQIARGYRFEAGTFDDSLGARMAVIEVQDTSQLVGVEIVYETVRALQLIWTDSTGKLPWQAGYRNPPYAQPFKGPLPKFRVRPVDGADGAGPVR